MARPVASTRLWASIATFWPIWCGGFWENGANSSFVNRVLDGSVPAASVARDPFDAEGLGQPHSSVVAPADLYWPERVNSQGIDLHDRGGVDGVAQGAR